MKTEKRRKIPNYIWKTIFCSTTSIIVLCLSYNLILLRRHAIGKIPLQETIEKIRYVFRIKNISHGILFLALLFRGWWYIGLATFPMYFLLVKLCLLIYDYVST
jgi:hypothetical protein